MSVKLQIISTSQWLRHAICLVLFLAIGCGEQAIEHVDSAPKKLTFTVVDAARVTPEVGSDPGNDERVFEVVAWLPGGEVDPNRPLLFMSHGWGGGPHKFDALATDIASQGIAVVSFTYPCTHVNAPGGFEGGIVDIADQPLDLSFILSWVLNARDDVAHPLFEQFSPQKVIALGHSLGGATLLRATRFACCKEERIVGTVFVSPAVMVTEVLFEDPDLLAEGPPTLIIHGQEDPVISPDESAELYSRIEPPRAFVQIPEANHEDLLESQVKPAIAVRETLQELVVGFVRHLVGDDQDASEWDWMLNELVGDDRVREALQDLKAP